MLHKDPQQRPNVDQIINTPFIRSLIGETHENKTGTSVDNDQSDEYCIWEKVPTKPVELNLQKVIKKFAKKEGASFCGKYKYDLNGINNTRSISPDKPLNQQFENDDDDDFFNLNRPTNRLYEKSKTFHVSRSGLFPIPNDNKGNYYVGIHY